MRAHAATLRGAPTICVSIELSIEHSETSVPTGFVLTEGWRGLNESVRDGYKRITLSNIVIRLMRICRYVYL